MANDVSEYIENIDSDFLSENNRPSFVALVGYADRESTDKYLTGWLPIFEKKNDIIPNQKQNFLHMKRDFDQYCREHKISA